MESGHFGIFDAIWCINYAPYTHRKANVNSELLRVGILPSERFYWNFTIRSPQSHILVDILRRHGLLKVETDTEFYIAMAHYGCIKASYEMGCDRILILEDDVCFLNDIKKVHDIFDATPTDYDIVLYDFSPLSKENYERNSAKRINEHFSEYDELHGAGCYSLSRNAMSRFIVENERSVVQPDVLTSRDEYNRGLRKCFAFESPVCQITYSTCSTTELGNSGGVHFVNSHKSLDYGDYNVPDGFGYGKTVPN